jgi:hypothetical protein
MKINQEGTMQEQDRIYIPPKLPYSRRRLGLDPPSWRTISKLLLLGALITGIIAWRLA